MPPKVPATFLEDETGAVTIDWVVLAGLVVGLAISVNILYQTMLGELPTNISTAVSEYGERAINLELE